MDAIGSDLQYAGVTVEAYAAGGAAYWDAFVEITRRAIRAAQGTGRSADRKTLDSARSASAPRSRWVALCERLA